jgi:hypothetical protein
MKSIKRLKDWGKLVFEGIHKAPKEFMEALK